VLQFASGAHGHWTLHFSSAGETMFKRLILGSGGTLDLPSDRSGRSLQLRRGEKTLSDEQLLGELPNYKLNAIESALFGERAASFDLEGPVTDRKLIAAEMHAFAEAIREKSIPESSGAMGLRSVAIIHAILESALAERPVTVAEVLDGSLHAYQDAVEAAAL
jgi:predicted dehydrogenase